MHSETGFFYFQRELARVSDGVVWFWRMGKKTIVLFQPSGVDNFELWGNMRARCFISGEWNGMGVLGTLLV